MYYFKLILSISHNRFSSNNREKVDRQTFSPLNTKVNELQIFIEK